MNKIKELRKQKKMKQSELAKAINVSQPTLSEYEAGKYEPGIETLKKIASVFDVSVDYLLGAENEKKPTPGSEDGLDPLEQQLMTYVKELTPEQKNLLRAQLQAWTEQNK